MLKENINVKSSQLNFSFHNHSTSTIESDRKSAKIDNISYAYL